MILCASVAPAQAPAVFSGGVLNGASFDKSGQPVAPGSLVSIYGTNLAAATGSGWGTSPLPTTLAGVTVTINDAAAPLANVIPGSGYDQINALIPWEVLQVLPPNTTASASVRVIVTRDTVSSAPFALSVAAAAPGIFTAAGNGVGQAIAFGGVDYQFAAPATSGLGSSPHPAKIGDQQTLVIYATGLGEVQTPVANGAPATGADSTKITPEVLVGEVPAQVVYSGLSGYVGVYQLNVILASGTPAGDAVSLQIRMNGITTRKDVTIAVSQ